MPPTSFLDPVPLWLLSLCATALVLLCIEAGWRIGHYHHVKSAGDESAPTNAAVGAVLGLLAFLLAFTFGMAATRYDTRKSVVLDEANAIGTTYLRTDFLSDKIRGEARALLREYAELRAGGASAIQSEGGRTKSADIQARLWKLADGAKSDSNPIYTGLFFQSLNEMIDLDETRVTAHRNRIPDSIWLMLGLVTIFSMTALGYQFGRTGKRSWGVTLLMVFGFTTVMMLIADLDRPQAGLLQVSQQPLLDILNQMSKTR